MGVIFDTGWEPADESGAYPSNHPIIMYDALCHFVSDYGTGSDVPGYDDVNADSWMTHEIFRPADTDTWLSSSMVTKYSWDGWSLNNGTLDTTKTVFTANTTLGNHRIQVTDATWAAEQMIFGIRIRNISAPEIRLQLDDGVTNNYAFYNLAGDGTVGSVVNADQAKIINHGNGEFTLVLVATPAAVTATGTLSVMISDGAENISWTPAGTEAFELVQFYFHDSIHFIRYTYLTGSSISCWGVAGHNLGNSAGQFRFQYDTTGADAWSTIHTEDLDRHDNSTVMFLHAPVTAYQVRLRLSHACEPEVAVLKVGSYIQFERPFYGSYSPSLGNRNTILRGNKTETGRFLGRSAIAVNRAASYPWRNLTTAWIDTLLYHKELGMLRSIEKYPFFFTWKPNETPSTHADFAWTTSPPSGPTKQGTRDLVSWSIDVEVLGDD